MKNKDWSDEFIKESKEENKNKTAGESDSFKALFGVPDSYANEKENKTAKQKEEKDIEEDILDKMFGSNSTTNGNNANQEEESDSMESEEKEKTDELEIEDAPKKSKIKNLKLRVISVALTLIIGGTAGFALYKTEPNRKVGKMNASEITVSNNDDNIKALTKIEGCLRISKIMKEYQDKNSYITNLDMGTVEVIDGKIAELSDEEYKTILELMDKLENASKKEKQTDEYKQMIKQFVGYSSKVNAYLVYYAPQSLNNIIIDEMKDDVEQVLKVSSDKVEVNYNHSSNTINIERTDGGVGEASYSLKSTGKVIDKLTGDLNSGTNSTIEIESFVNDSTKTISTIEESTITKDPNGSLIVEYSEKTNKELEDRVKRVKLQMYRTSNQKNGEFSYNYLVPRDNAESSQIQDSSKEQASGYTRKRTM